jgi:heat shock protein HslJ
MTFRRLFPLAFLATVSLVSCEKNEVSPSAAVLLDNHWMLTQVDDFPLFLSSYGPSNRSSLSFVALGECTVGLGPCNNFSGRFHLGSSPQQLSITPQIPTQVSCPVQELESHFLTNLALTARYEVNGNELRLYDASTATPRLIFRQEQR